MVDDFLRTFSRAVPRHKFGTFAFVNLSAALTLSEGSDRRLAILDWIAAQGGDRPNVSIPLGPLFDNEDDPDERHALAAELEDMEDHGWLIVSGTVRNGDAFCRTTPKGVQLLAEVRQRRGDPDPESGCAGRSPALGLPRDHDRTPVFSDQRPPLLAIRRQLWRPFHRGGDQRGGRVAQRLRLRHGPRFRRAPRTAAPDPDKPRRAGYGVRQVRH